MTKRERLFTVLGGCFGAVLTMAVCSVMPLGAQNGDATFGKITCTGLKVVDAEEKTRVWLNASGGVGMVWVWGKKAGSALLYADDRGGRIEVNGRDEVLAAMGVNKHGNGAVSTWDKNGYRLASLK